MSNKKSKSKAELLFEIDELRRRVRELESTVDGQQQREENVARQAKILESIFENLGDGIGGWDAAADDDRGLAHLDEVIPRQRAQGVAIEYRIEPIDVRPADAARSTAPSVAMHSAAAVSAGAPGNRRPGSGAV